MGRGPRVTTIAPLRVAAIDMGTNSTRLLVADVVDGVVDPVHRESRVTGLGRGVETSGQLATEAIENVYEAVGDYQAILTDLDAEEIFAFATSVTVRCTQFQASGGVCPIGR